MSTVFCENYSAFNEKLSVVRADHHLKKEPTHFSQTEDLKKACCQSNVTDTPVSSVHFESSKFLEKVSNYI